MSLIPIDGNVQFVQDTTPSNPANGDVWVDTSLSPSQTKIYDANASAFVQPRELSNLDAKVSNAGASLADIEAGAEDALEEDIANLSPASNSVAANLDGGVAAVDWSTKDYATSYATTASHYSNTWLDISGSGFLSGISGTGPELNVSIQIDGGDIIDHRIIKNYDNSLALPNIRFNNSLKVAANEGPDRFRGVWVVLD
jgi:hypothetical protein